MTVENRSPMIQSRGMTTETRQFTDEQKKLLTALEAYEPWDEQEAMHRNVILEQVRATPLWWHRDTLPGHVTASGFVTDPSFSFLLLHHHRKLDRWLQLGGHDEGEKNPMKAVLREVREESGLQEFRFQGSGGLFDLDVHVIPESRKQAAHNHLDCRFLLVADPEAPLIREETESKALQWFPLGEALRKMNEVGALRVIEKIQKLKSTI